MFPTLDSGYISRLRGGSVVEETQEQMKLPGERKKRVRIKVFFCVALSTVDYHATRKSALAACVLISRSPLHKC